MNAFEYSKIKKLLDIYDRFYLNLNKLKNDYFMFLKKQNQSASEAEIDNLRKKIQNL